MEFRILGPLEVLEKGQALDLDRGKPRVLLAMLLLQPNRVVTKDHLIEALWEEGPPGTASKALQVYVSQLRKAMGENRLETKAPGYLLRVEDGELDLQQFCSLLEAGRPREALTLWRGPPLADFHYLRFAQAEIARLEELHLVCQEERIEQDLSQGRHAALVGELEGLVSEHPLRERLRTQLMLALYRCGRQAEALDAYQDARRTLTEELGIEPSKSLRKLQQAILSQDPALDLSVAVEEVEPHRSVFVGRERELEVLLSGFAETLASRGRLILLVGEPGIGKSRLADELAARARARGAGVLVGRCWEAGGAPAYWPWVQSLRVLIRETDPETLRAQLGAGAPDLAQLLPELRHLFPDLPEPPAMEAESARFRLFEAASAFLKRAADSRPLVLVLDDLHAADQPSLLLLQFLARELGESRLLVLGAYRNVDPSPADPLTTTLTELTREPVTSIVALAGLDEQDVRRFIELTSGESAANELVAVIHEETEGNPLFVGEIVRLLTAEGSLPESGVPRLAIPQSVRDVIARRLRHLSQECNRVLVLASVLGREFALEALGPVAGVSENELLETLDQAMVAGVISDVPGSPGHLRFAHVLIRDTLYDGLTTARRVRLHRLAVEALEALYGQEPGPHLAELAYHCTAGSEFAKGLHYAQLAGDRALALLAYEEAARLYQSALDAGELSGLTDETRCELLLSLSEAEARAGNTPVAKEVALEAAEIARKLELPGQLARAAVNYSGRLAWARAGDDDRLVPLLEEALRALGDTDIELRARLLARLAGALRDEHSRERRDTLSREAVELSRRLGNAAALAYALDGRALAIFAPDSLAEVLAIANELIPLGKQIGDGERVLQGHADRFVVAVTLGDVGTAKADLDAAIRIADELRQPAQLGLVYAVQAMVGLAEGRLGEAEELVERAFTFAERSHAHLGNSAYHAQRYTLCEFRGNLEEIEPAIRTLVNEHPARPLFHCLLAYLHVRGGRADAARREFEKLAIDGFAVLPFELEWLYGMSYLAETCVLLGDQDSATALYRLLLPHGALNVVDPPEGIRGSVSRYLGLLSTTLERWDDAARHFEDAVAMNERMGVRPWLAHTQSDYARMLVARGGPSDGKRARELLDLAHTTYRELGIETYAASVSSLSI
ncbi:MAG: hypothetical protein C5B48_02610 [Candidatus Rokuibacteriota bacterium]|nr:MAG: hypothetical protein C5B48_02610 [Candidatus Rokubacteria bacterium]